MPRTLDRYTAQGLAILQDPEKSIEMPFADGKAPGLWNLFQSQFPPQGTDRSSTAVSFYVDCHGWGIEVKLNVTLISPDDYGKEIFVLGYLTGEFTSTFMCDQNAPHPHVFKNPEFRHVGARYDPNLRKGVLILTHGMCELIRKKNKLSPDAFPPLQPVRPVHHVRGCRGIPCSCP